MTAAADMTRAEYFRHREDEAIEVCGGDTPRTELRDLMGQLWDRDWTSAIWDRVYRERGTLAPRVWASILRCGWRWSDIYRIHGMHCAQGGQPVAAVVARLQRPEVLA